MSLKSRICRVVAAVAAAGLLVTGATVAVGGVRANAAPSSVAETAQTSGRVEVSFNNDWRFWEGNVSGADAADYDDSEWLYVNVPHSTIKYTPENYYHEDLGVFWYRRHFETPETVQGGRRALLTFDGAMQKAEVWLNGEKLGTHEGGYTEFSYDITDKLAPAGEENALAVKLDTNPNASFAPGKNNPDFQYFGGLYRNVTLTVTDPVRVTDAVSSGTVGGGGVFLATTALADDHSSATVNAKTEVENNDAAEAQVTVKTELLDEDGSVAAAADSTQAVPAGEKVTFNQDLAVAGPRLWSTDTPELYTVRTTVSKGGEACDTVETTFGIRTVEWVRDSGGTACLINGERVHLNGTNLHSETYMLGNAVSDDAVDAEIKRLREYGFNFVRMAHYPHSQAFYDACDKYGVAVLDCLSGWQQFYDTDAFKNNTYQQIREMVRANRNHASIVAWEPSLNESSYTEAWAREANATTKAEYPDNGAAKAWTCGWMYWNVFDMGCGTPQANVNGDAGRYTDKPVIVSEYGDWNYGGYDSTTRVTREPTHYADAKGGDEGMLQQADNAQASYAWNRTKSWSGEYGATAFWQYADYAGFDVDKLTYCGVVDVARIPKFSAYFFQSQRDPSVDLSEYGLDSGPMIYIASSWADDSPSEVRVYTNCDEVEIFVDGVSVERRSTPDATMWDARATMSDDGSGQPSPLETNGEGGTGGYVSTEGIEYPPFTFDLTGEATPGEGTIKVVGYIDGEAVAEFERQAPGEPAALELEAESDDALKLDGSTAKLVWVSVTDANGTVVNDASNTVTFSTSGPGYVVGSKQLDVRGGVWAVWVRGQRTDAATPIVLTAESDGLAVATLEIPTEVVPGLPEAPEGGDFDDTDYEQPAPPANIMLDKAVTASSVNDKGGGVLEKAEYAVDGDTSTKWCASAGGETDYTTLKHWIQIDLGTTYAIDEVSITFDSGPQGDMAYRYAIAVSDDADSFSATAPEGLEVTTADAQSVTKDMGGVEGRYVRVYMNCPGSSLWPCVYEISGVGEAVGNIALGKDASAQGAAADGAAGLAVDGNYTTHWSRGAAGPAWWQVDLGVDYLVDGATVSFLWDDVDDTGNPVRHRFTLQASSDGERWEDVAEWSDYDQADQVLNPTATIDLSESPVEARYLRVADLEAKRQDNGSAQWVEISEFTATGEELSGLLDLEYNKVATASSCADGVTPGDGNEGNPAKHWAPAADDAEAWWMVDTAGIYDMSEVQFTWAGETETHRYKVEVSRDGETWTTVANHMTGGVSGLASSDRIGSAERYLRVSVAQGTTEGFYVRLKGRATSTELLATEVLTVVEPVVAEVGTPLSELGLPAEVKVQLEDGTATYLAVDWTTSAYDPTGPGTMTLDGALEAIPGVTLGEEPLSVAAEVTLEKPEPVLVRIEVTAPAKVDYEQGEELDLAGMKVEAVYSDGAGESRVDVTNQVTVEGFDPETAGTQTITVTFEGMADTFQVTVVEAETPDPDPGTDPDPGPSTDPGVDPEPGTDPDPDPDAKPGVGDDQQTPDADGPAEIPATGDAANLVAPLACAGLAAISAAAAWARRE